MEKVSAAAKIVLQTRELKKEKGQVKIRVL
jgi:hypothetical protein